MIALSPAPRPPLLDRINRWSGWSGLAVSAAVLVVAGGVLVVSSKLAPAAAPSEPKVVVRPLPAGIVDLKVQIARNARSLNRYDLAASNFHSVAVREVDGKRVLEVRVVPQGPTIILDAETGEVIEQREPRRLPQPRIPGSVPVS